MDLFVLVIAGHETFLSGLVWSILLELKRTLPSQLAAVPLSILRVPASWAGVGRGEMRGLEWPSGINTYAQQGQKMCCSRIVGSGTGSPSEHVNLLPWTTSFLTQLRRQWLFLALVHPSPVHLPGTCKTHPGSCRSRESCCQRDGAGPVLWLHGSGSCSSFFLSAL